MKAAAFFAENEKAISDYTGQSGLRFEMGDSWSFDIEKGHGTFDPVFFYRKGFSEAECMWAVCHEMERLLDWLRDPDGYSELYGRIGKERRLDLLYQYLNDILADREVDRRFPAHRETRNYFYGSILFPRVDYSSAPKHLQYITAMMRERMLPVEAMILSPDVRKELKALANIDGEGTDLVDLVTDPTARPRDRFGLIRDYIEPVYERFFKEDVNERRSRQQQKTEKSDDVQKGESVKGGPLGSERGFIEDESIRRRDRKLSGQPQKMPRSDEELFAVEYDESEEKLPHAFSRKEARDEIEREMKRQIEESRTAEQMAKEQFRSQHGVTAEEIEDYAEEYRRIETHIQPLRGVFERIISTRKEVRRRLKERAAQGVIIDPSQIAQAYIDARSGVWGSRTQLKVAKEEFDENKPKDFEFTLICDLSGSMNENWPGGKSYEQKSSSILIAEALDEFEKRLKGERLEKNVDLHVLTEVRGFHSDDEELKPLSDSIDFHTRVKISRRLDSCTGGRTADYKSLARVAAKIDDETRKRIESKDLKKVLILITDGGSDDIALASEAKNRLDEMEVIARAIRIGRASDQDAKKFEQVWGRDGSPCLDVSQLVNAIEKLLEDFLKDL